MPKKYIVLSIFFLVLLLALLAGLSFWGYVTHTVDQPIVPGDLTDYNFAIHEGESVSEILTNLQSKGFLEKKWILQIYLRLKPDLSTDIQAGQYELGPGFSMLEIIQTFENGRFQQRLTLIEGWRREQYVSYLLAQMEEEFAREFWGLTQSLEGSLFPDTYFYDASTTPVQLLEKIQNNYQEKIEAVGFLQEIEQNNLSEREGVIIASIVEKEVADPTDQALVAGILIKRFQNGWPLEADATIQYAKATNQAQESGVWESINQRNFDWWPKVITAQDLEIDSPYNTRKNNTLAPSPICNPGLTAIEAVAKPLESPYWYYLTDESGITRYAETLEGHNQNSQMFGVSN